MLNTTSINVVNGAKFSQSFTRPLYDSYCFSNIPEMIMYLLTGEGRSALPQDALASLPQRYNKVILFFVDAFGWRFFERYADKYALLKLFLEQGIVSKLTSQFPSTTAAHVTCIHTGLNVGQSGIYEWNYYEPLVDEMITPLLFAYAGDKTRDTLKRAKVPAEAYFPRQTLYSTLQARGVASYVFQSAAFTPSTPSNVLFKGASVFPYKQVSDALARLSHLLQAQNTSPAYYFLYFDTIDLVGHIHGPNSKEFEQAVNAFFTTVERSLFTLLQGKRGDTLFLMTADHGQVEVDGSQTVYLNQHIPGIERYLRTNRHGRPLVPAGSARDMFLYVRQERLDEAIALLQKHLEGRAEVYRTEELVTQGFFGREPPSSTFLARVGNVVILPYQGETVWWYEYGKFDMHFSGHHGGLLPEEMEIPLCVLAC